MLKAKDFRQRAWNHLKGNWTAAVLTYLIMSVILSAISFTGIGTLLVSGPLVVGYSLLMLNIARGNNPKIENLFEGFEEFVRAFVLWITNELLIALWSLLFIIPGIIKTLSYSMSYYILLDNPEMSANEARKRSMQMMDGNKWRLFCLNFSFIGWILLSFLTFGILLFWVAPYMEAAKAEFYQSLLDNSDAPLNNEHPFEI